jgi:uncharacterized protein YegP (UPF0339 family)
MRFEIFRGRTTYKLMHGYALMRQPIKWYVRVRAANGRILCTSEAYTRHSAAWKFVQTMRAGVKDAPVIEVP